MAYITQRCDDLPVYPETAALLIELIRALIKQVTMPTREQQPAWSFSEGMFHHTTYEKLLARGHKQVEGFGSSFQELLDEGRFEIARQLLEDTRLEVSQIAVTLDYADARAFTRTFRRWSGTTPAQWRKNRKTASLRMN
ncbi:MAG: helix-turn-helix domain-containing protein [Gammaproteobacteria bacterium]